MAFLLKHRGEVALHAGELVLGQADLVLAAGHRDDASRILRIVAEPLRENVVGRVNSDGCLRFPLPTPTPQR